MYKTAKINFITPWAEDVIRTAYYILGPWCDEINFLLFYMCHSMMDLTRCYKTATELDACGEHQGERIEAPKAPSGLGYGKGCPLPSRLGGLWERREFSQWGPGQSPGQKRILAYFEGHRTLLFATICWCFQFVEQCFMSHNFSGEKYFLGGKVEICAGGNCPLTQRRTAPDDGARKFHLGAIAQGIWGRKPPEAEAVCRHRFWPQKRSKFKNFVQFTS